VGLEKVEEAASLEKMVKDFSLMRFWRHDGEPKFLAQIQANVDGMV
jgi:hypothetical protein